MTLGCLHDVAYLGPADADDAAAACELVCRCGAQILAGDPIKAHRVHQVHVAASAVRT